MFSSMSCQMNCTCMAGWKKRIDNLTHAIRIGKIQKGCLPHQYGNYRIKAESTVVFSMSFGIFPKCRYIREKRLIIIVQEKQCQWMASITLGKHSEIDTWIYTQLIQVRSRR
ncbi:hypothetical protein CEXT_559361 [Caerostris extrusa]|uniref:Uncharacterized protein n=1 Tax=Caerostris extrusa TaxID=172846 RepID=A0AAV4UUT1_CAEEX|nr:hypothetical protein CEXT_559361 [Caerostris extrusa]